MSDQFNDDMVRAVVAATVRKAKVIALREAAQAYAGNNPVVVEFLLFRADEIEAGDRS